MSICDQCEAPEAVVNLDGDNLCQSCADKWVRAERHQCSFSSSSFVGGPAHSVTFHCNECGEEWEKDVS